MDWNYKMYINGMYWKGFAENPTPQQKSVETRSFKNSDIYDGGKVEVMVIRTKFNGKELRNEQNK